MNDQKKTYLKNQLGSPRWNAILQNLALSARVGGFLALQMFVYYKVFAMVTKQGETSHRRLQIVLILHVQNSVWLQR